VDTKLKVTRFRGRWRRRLTSSGRYTRISQIVAWCDRSVFKPILRNVLLTPRTAKVTFLETSNWLASSGRKWLRYMSGLGRVDITDMVGCSLLTLIKPANMREEMACHESMRTWRHEMGDHLLWRGESENVDSGAFKARKFQQATYVIHKGT
jgi:hypothetical protein